MQIDIIEDRKNILIRYENIDTPTSFTKTINNVDFIPDEMIVKNISFAAPLSLLTGTSADHDFGLGADPYNRIVCIWTNLVNDYIATFTDNGNCKSNAHYQIKKLVKGTYIFNLTDINNNPFDWNGDITIELEFVKYRQVSESILDGSLVSLSGKALQKIY